MKLSEAITIGRSLRPETHQGEMFSRLTNLDQLGSDVWGAACEAVHSQVAKRDWTDLSINSDKEYAADILQKYFGDYWKMPAVCPGAKPLAVSEGAGRIVNTKGEFAVEGERQRVIGTLTTACREVVSLGQLIGHMFYVHNWTSAECAQAAEWYEQMKQAIMPAQMFDHFQSESLRQIIAQNVVSQARQREFQRYRRATNFRSHAH